MAVVTFVVYKTSAAVKFLFQFLYFSVWFQNDTKPVKMMHQKTKFPLTFIPEANCQVIKLFS